MLRKKLTAALCAVMAMVTLLSGCAAFQPVPIQIDPVSPSQLSPQPVDPDPYIAPYEEPEVSYDDGLTPFERHGALHVDGINLMDEKDNRYQLYGMSTHGIAWYPQFVNYDAFLTLRDEWNVNCVRISLYTAESSGYCAGGNRTYLKAKVQTGLDSATELGLYAILDWHVLKDENPLNHLEDAIEFFGEMSANYAENDNIIYEICSEPNGSTTWSEVKEYAEQVIPVIRANDPNALIIVGSPSWSQDIDKALEEPLEFDNVMYALHFYAGTHKYWLRDKLEDCLLGGLPVFISEFGTCDSTGQGAVDHAQSKEWKKLIDYYNLSYIAWNLANKNETCSVIKNSCKLTSGWAEEDLTEHGLLVRSWFLEEKNP